MGAEARRRRKRRNPHGVPTRVKHCKYCSVWRWHSDNKALTYLLAFLLCPAALCHSLVRRPSNHRPAACRRRWANTRLWHRSLTLLSIGSVRERAASRGSWADTGWLAFIFFKRSFTWSSEWAVWNWCQDHRDNIYAFCESMKHFVPRFSSLLIGPRSHKYSMVSADRITPICKS